MTPLWPHQMTGIDAVAEAFARGVRRVLLTSPTGMGKSRIVAELIRHYAGTKGWHAALYTNRRLMIDQLGETLNANGIEYGVRAAGHEDERQVPVQVCSVPTEGKRTLTEMARWQIHGFARNCLAVFDEAHLHQTGNAVSIMERHAKAGHLVLGVTATPVGLGDLYDELIVAGTNSEGRRCGALVPCVHYGCDEPDTRKLKRRREPDSDTADDLSASELRTLFPKSKQLVGRVLEWFEKLNPTRRPTILFACGVDESVWFAQQFTAAGVKAAHIDGDVVWVGGEFYKSDRVMRREVLDGSRTGEIKVVCNRFVMREGVDCPWLGHGILATVFGSLQSYLQSGGRLLRSHAGVDQVSLQDHGGNWWRHGSLNADRVWELDDTAAALTGVRRTALRLKRCAACGYDVSGVPAGGECPDCGTPVEKEPCGCPKCGKILGGRYCGDCGYEIPLGRQSRPVVMADGRLTEYTGDIFRPRRVARGPDRLTAWVKVYFQSYNAGKSTFGQAVARYAMENDWGWPDPAWPYMPTRPTQYYSLVRDVPRELLVQPRRGAATEAT